MVVGMTTVEKIIDWFTENPEDFNEAIEDLDRINGYLDEDRVYEMEELEELYDGDVVELLRRAFYGYDAENTNDPFCPNRKYFYSVNGNLVSTDTKDYSDKLDESTILEMAEHQNYICPIVCNGELSNLFEQLEIED